MTNLIILTVFLMGQGFTPSFDRLGYLAIALACVVVFGVCAVWIGEKIDKMFNDKR